MSRHLDPFYSAKLPFRSLHGDIDNLQYLTQGFINGHHLEPRSERDPNTGDLIYKVRIIFDVPDDIERDAVRFLSEIRGTLDKSIHGSAQILGGRSMKHTNFPFGDAQGGKVAFEKQLASEGGPWRGIPDEIRPYLLELAPYPEGQGYTGGNNLLSFLGEFSNPAKHQNVLMVNLQVNGLAITQAQGRFFFPTIQTIWNAARDECEVFRLSPSSGKMEFSIPTDITFNDVGVLGHVRFTSVLRDLARMAESIVLGVEAKTFEALKAREN